ncbi:hypothetical protein ACKF11_13400 [Methylobacillus sp. Pita2]|uniref:deoxynucleotide monophosphate kinase family protein n=1 Tax=Methylobacillus sp. Pita2 TaxID=3383245 RepID=UPI0038B54251
MKKLDGFRLIGFHGPARSGKDTLIAMLQQQFSVPSVAFSDAIYDEVQQAYRLRTQDVLRSVHTKDAPTRLMRPTGCHDLAFRKLLAIKGHHDNEELSPRQVLQYWGDHRRAKDPIYFIKMTAKRISHLPQGIVLISGVRSQNEADFIRGNDGFLIHVHRDVAKVNDHKIEAALPVHHHDTELDNNGSIQELEATAIKLAQSIGMVAPRHGFAMKP